MVKKYIFLVVYKLFAKHLPPSGYWLGGQLFRRIRVLCCRQIFKKVGENVNIEHGASFIRGFNIIIGDNSGIGIDCHVPDNIVIGNDVMMGPKCFILDRNHLVDRTDIPMRGRGFVFKQTILEDDIWIGRQCIFTPGRIVRKGTIIAAGTVLCKDFPEYSIVGGNPSRLIKNRKSDSGKQANSTTSL